MLGLCARMVKILTALMTLAIGVTTLMPSTGGHSPLLGLDKLAHLVAFAALVIPITMAHPRSWALIWVVALSYGGRAGGRDGNRLGAYTASTFTRLSAVVLLQYVQKEPF